MRKSCSRRSREELLLLTTRFVSLFLSPFGIEVDDLLACPTDISHGKATTMFSLSCANFFRFRRRLRMPDRLTSRLF